MLASTLLLVVSVVYVILGVVVWNRAPDRVWNRMFGLHSLAVGGWIFFNHLLQATSSLESAGLWLRLTHPFAAMSVCTTLDFAWAFPDRIRPAPPVPRLMLYAVGLAASTVALAPDLWTHMEFDRGTVIVEYGWPFGLFGLFVIAVIVLADRVMLRKRRRLSGVQRAQVSYVLTGMIAAQIGSIGAIVVLPLLTGETYFSRWGPAAYVFMAVSMSYAIAKHHIIPPTTALFRAVGYVGTAVLVAIAGGGAALVLHWMLPVYNLPGSVPCAVGGLVAGGLALPVHRCLRRRLERVVLPQALLEPFPAETGDAILRTLDVDQLLRYLCDAVLLRLQAGQVSVLLRDAASGLFVRRSYRAQEGSVPSPAHPQVLSPGHLIMRAVGARRDLLHRDEVFRFHPLGEAQRIAAALHELDLQILAPIVWEDALIGVLALGDRVSGEMYEEHHLVAIRQMVPQVSLALRNAQTYAEMARTKEFNDNVLREMESGVIAVDADERIVLYNPAAERILGRPRSEVLGRDLAALPGNVAGGLQRILQQGRPRYEERMAVQRPDGETVPVAFHASRWGAGSGQRGGAVAVMNDLTVVQELERERQEAERLALIRLLSAGMAHEIRNPLVAIRTFAELLPSRWEDEDFRSTFMDTARGEIDRITQLTSQMLMLSKPADVVAKEIDVNALCEKVVRATSARAESQQVRLIADFPPLRLRPQGDEGRLQQALVNLVHNAFDAEEPGGQVRVRTEEVLHGDNGGRVLIRVHNAGSYIPPEQVELIFKPFHSEKAGGTGLGLAICQTIVEEHQGALTLTSETGAGTEFTISLAVKARAATPGGSAAA